MTSQGSAHGRFTRAIQTRNLWAAETAMRELGQVSLADALDYLEVLAAVTAEVLAQLRALSLLPVNGQRCPMHLGHHAPHDASIAIPILARESSFPTGSCCHTPTPGLALRIPRLPP
jgi:hypothetical protein